jgi:hypothetical protein
MIRTLCAISATWPSRMSVSMLGSMSFSKLSSALAKSILSDGVVRTSRMTLSAAAV